VDILATIKGKRQYRDWRFIEKLAGYGIATRVSFPFFYDLDCTFVHCDRVLNLSLKEIV